MQPKLFWPSSLRSTTPKLTIIYGNLSKLKKSCKNVQLKQSENGLHVCVYN